MKILVLGKFYPPDRGGIETLTRSLCGGLAQLGAEVDCVVAHRAPRTVAEQDGAVRVRRLASFGTLFSMSLCPAYLFATRRPASIWHAHLPNPLADAACLMGARTTPLVLSYHSDVVRQGAMAALYGPIQRRMLARADRIVVATPRHIDCSDVLPAFRSKCVVIPHGIDLRRFELDARQAAEADGLRAGAGGRPIVLNVGRLVGYKGQRYLIEAIRDTDTVAWIVGSGPLESELKRLAAGLGCSDRVRFWDNVADEQLPLLYHACDMFVLSSVTPNEAFGLAQVEAMACAKPVISCDLPSGVPFVNQDGRTGLVVPPADAPALARAIRALTDSPSRALEMGRHGLSRARAEFDENVMIRRYWDCFLDLIP